MPDYYNQIIACQSSGRILNTNYSPAWITTSATTKKLFDASVIVFARLGSGLATEHFPTDGA
jgi:hypothetical protein